VIGSFFIQVFLQDVHFLKHLLLKVINYTHTHQSVLQDLALSLLPFSVKVQGMISSLILKIVKIVIIVSIGINCEPVCNHL